MGSSTISRTPAHTPGSDSVPPPSPNGRRIETTSAAETRKLTASTASSCGADAPAPSSSPPRSGPSRYDAEDEAATSAFARGSDSAGTRFGIAEADEGSNGLCTTASSPNSSASASAESTVSAIAAATTAAARSEPTITRRRSNRSPIQPAAGAPITEPTTPKKSAAETQSADPVSL